MNHEDHDSECEYCKKKQHYLDAIDKLIAEAKGKDEMHLMMQSMAQSIGFEAHGSSHPGFVMADCIRVISEVYMGVQRAIDEGAPNHAKH